VKINVDAAVRKQGSVGSIAVVARDDHGSYLGASVVVIRGITDSTILEALACREALSLAMDLQLTRIEVASDSMEVINNMEGKYLGKVSTIIQEIEFRAEGLVSVSFIHEQRTSNMEAHGLKK
jgi:ribonuclease HI